MVFQPWHFEQKQSLPLTETATMMGLLQLSRCCVKVAVDPCVMLLVQSIMSYCRGQRHLWLEHDFTQYLIITQLGPLRNTSDKLCNSLLQKRCRLNHEYCENMQFTVDNTAATLAMVWAATTFYSTKEDKIRAWQTVRQLKTFQEQESSKNTL